jgi:serine/threonine-protein kinase
MEGRKLGHFRLEQFVGAGGMGSVYRATDMMLGRSVAVKILPPERGADDETARRFENEAQSAARLDHENIARVFHVGEEDGLKYIVFEYIHGVNIRDLVRQNGPLPLEDAISYVLQVAEALAHAAKRDVVHRDIKPSNVLVTPDGLAKLVDMGLARRDSFSADHHDLTASGVTLGTFDYISPEQARDPRSADVRSDLYSLGCTFYFMLTGRPPFPEGTVLQKLLSHSSDEPTDLQVLRPELPDAVAAIGRRLLAKDPDARFQEPSELVGQLLLAAEQLGLHPASRSGTVWISASSPQLSLAQRHIPWLVPLAILLLVVAGMEWIVPSHSQVTPTVEGFLASAQSERQATDLPAGAASPPREPAITGGPGQLGASPSPLQPAMPTAAAPAQPPRPRDATTSAGAPRESGARGGILNRAADSVSTERETQRESDGTAAVDSNRRLPPIGSSPSVSDPDIIPADAPPPVDRSAASPVAQTFDRSPPEAPPAGRAEPPLPAASRRDLLIVGPYREPSAWDKSLFCESLEAACRKAMALPEIRVIELRYNGYRNEPDKPFTLANPDLTIRAADGFTPVVHFRPEPARPAMFPSSMIRVVGGKLRLDGVELELDVPVDSQVRWQLLELQQVEQLELDRCVLTVRDPAVRRSSDPAVPDPRRVAVIDLEVPPGSDSMMDRQDEAMGGWSVLALRSCVVRGEATMVRCEEAVPFRLNWKNGLLATSERMLFIGGTQSDPEEKDEHIRVELQHVTAVMDRGLCRIDSDDEMFPFMMTVDITSSQCIFMVAPLAPLIEQIGTVQSDPAELDSGLLFSGGWNFYEDVEVYLSKKACIRSHDQSAQPEYVSQVLEAEDWKQRWRETLAKSNKVAWRRLPVIATPMHEHTPEDYLLDNRLGNQAIDSGPGPSGGDAGFQPASLVQPYAQRHRVLPPPAGG